MIVYMRVPRILRRRSLQQSLLLAFVLFCVFDFTFILRSLSRFKADPIVRRPERVYIASIHWNNEKILRSHWNDAVVGLAKALGPENVFVTIYESGSWDDTKGALRDLDVALEAHQIRRKITLSDTDHILELNATEKGPGWVITPQGSKSLRRIPYLSRLRNWTLEPLRELAGQGEVFDKVLFLNDVAFTNNDIFRLLDTNNGEYAAACSLDFSHPPQFYDTFALRDAEGHEALMQTWPYFRAKASRQAILESRPVPVTSCWNGIVAMPAGPFVSTSSLHFRGISDSLAVSHLEGSECCLIHIDNPLRLNKGTYVNPLVLVGYSGEAYDAVHSSNFFPAWRVFMGMWENRIRRWLTTPWFKEWAVRKRVEQWRREGEGREEYGGICLINEMQILTTIGWAHV